MSAYYNENDAFAVAWLRELIKTGCIAPGDVDERDIRDVLPVDLLGYGQHHFFAGIGVWSHALRRARWPDDRPVWTGSCPCQPFSAAGKRGGTADERHLWPAWFHLIGECKPARILGEQVASGDGLAWLDLVQADLEGAGYACGAVDLCAAGVGAPHLRQRLWFMAHANNAERRPEEPARHNGNGTASRWDESHRDAWQRLHGPDWRIAAAEFCADAHGPAASVGRLRGYGNAINAEAARVFIEAYLNTRHVRLEDAWTGVFA